MIRARTILVLGAYGLVGRELVRILVDKTDATVIASGRKTDRLAALRSGLDEDRVVIRVLDARDASAVAAAEWNMKREYERAVASGVEVDALLRVTAQREGKEWQVTLRLPDGGAIPTAYLPAIAAKRFLESRFGHVGLVTPIDVFSPEGLFAEMRDLGWSLDLEEH